MFPLRVLLFDNFSYKKCETKEELNVDTRIPKKYQWSLPCTESGGFKVSIILILLLGVEKCADFKSTFVCRRRGFCVDMCLRLKLNISH